MEKSLEIMDDINGLPIVSSKEDIFIPELEKKLKKWLPNYSIKNIDDNLLVFPNVKTTENLLLAHVDEIGFLIKRQISENTYELITVGLVDKLAAHGSKVQTIFNNKEYIGIIGNVLPHSGKSSEKLIVEFSENVNLPPLWPIQFINDPVFDEYIMSKTLDNRLGIASIINTAIKKNVTFVLTVGEEEGTQRLRNLMKIIPDYFDYNDVIVIDAAPSNQDVYYEEKTMINEGDLGFIAVEGGGKGNVAPERLIEKTKSFIKKSNIKMNLIETHFTDEITDATNLYKMGFESISVCYPVRYLHNSFEVANKETVRKINELLINI